MPSLNKSALSEKVARRLGLNAKTASEALNSVLDTIAEEVAMGNEVNIAGFGSFRVRHSAARNGRNPQTGETIQIAAKKTPAFKPGKAFKDAVNK